MKYLIVCAIFLIGCSSHDTTNRIVTITGVIEVDNNIGFEIETDSFLIHEMYELPLKSNYTLKTRADSLFAFRKYNQLRIKSCFSKTPNVKSWAEEYYLEKPNWKKIMTFDTIDNSIENIRIEINKKPYFVIDYNPDKTIKNEVSNYLIEIIRESSDSTCIIIEQPGYKYLDYEYEFFVSMNDSRQDEITMKNISVDKLKAYGKICKKHQPSQDSLFIKCKLSKIISRKEVGENIEVLQTNTEFEFAQKIPEVGNMITLRDYVR